jgi:hypothetical protein
MLAEQLLFTRSCGITGALSSESRLRQQLPGHRARQAPAARECQLGVAGEFAVVRRGVRAVVRRGLSRRRPGALVGEARVAADQFGQGGEFGGEGGAALAGDADPGAGSAAVVAFLYLDHARFFQDGEVAG